MSVAPATYFLKLNDIWEFDLPRGYSDLRQDTSDVEFRDGILVTTRGGPAVIAHTWWGLTYGPRHKALLFMNTWVTDRKS